MNPDILMVRVDDGYRVLHGHLHLINAFNLAEEVIVEVRDQGPRKVRKTQAGLIIEDDEKPVPVLKY